MTRSILARSRLSECQIEPAWDHAQPGGSASSVHLEDSVVHQAGRAPENEHVSGIQAHALRPREARGGVRVLVTDSEIRRVTDGNGHHRRAARQGRRRLRLVLVVAQAARRRRVKVGEADAGGHRWDARVGLDGLLRRALDEGPELRRDGRHVHGRRPWATARAPVAVALRPGIPVPPKAHHLEPHAAAFARLRPRKARGTDAEIPAEGHDGVLGLDGQRAFEVHHPLAEDAGPRPGRGRSEGDQGARRARALTR
eukprot:CAMPEP_0206025452 /NCGR_PEP_ID=MMETSP1464-20131121/40056_1 /ASSEMBLY_ACC=CAM_ASM_001124 /TAXON_ID=119497 /ORGANISM="Exanthemachrysis gayraliae, Strain RCC1523" /LENGTH=254 /DNA_ID=CAMNT_0053399487 /DNA_START=862 /DNA_END=1622 /DNA_ORIENTATION=+